MMRLINYLLYLITLFIFLAIVIPYGLFEWEYKQQLTKEVSSHISGLTPLAIPNFNIVGSLVSFFLFTFFAIGLVFVQQWLWITNVQKYNDYKINEKYLKLYKWSGAILFFGIAFLYFWFFITWSVPINFNINDLQSIKQAINIRRALYITCLVIIALFSFGSIGYSAYINLMISYQQQISFVDEMVEKGEYDPVTRQPYENTIIDIDTTDIKITEHDNDQNKLKDKKAVYEGSAGLLSSSENLNDESNNEN